MARSGIAGMTDYSHQSFNDILIDLQNSEKLVVEVIEVIESNIQKLEINGYWTKMPFNFKSIIGYSIKHFKTTQEELKNIQDEIQKAVQPHHIKRLQRIATVGSQINIDIGKYWNDDFERHKNYDEPEFQQIEEIYGNCRDMAVSLLDLDNMANRLKDFVGKTSSNMENKQTSFEHAKFGDNTVIVVGENNVVNPSQIKKNDFEALEKLLHNNKINQADIDELKEILKSENPDAENKKLGVKANNWISKMVGKCLDGSWAIGIGAAGKLLADAIKHYYGLFQ